MRVNTRYVNSTRGASSGVLLWEDVPLAEFMRLVFIYTHAGWELPWTTPVFVVLVLCILSSNELPCVLVLHKHSGPHSVSILFPVFRIFYAASSPLVLTHDVGFFVCLLVWCFCLKKKNWDAKWPSKMIPYYDEEMNVGWKMNIWKYDKQR